MKGREKKGNRGVGRSKVQPPPKIPKKNSWERSGRTQEISKTNNCRKTQSSLWKNSSHAKWESVKRQYLGTKWWHFRLKGKRKNAKCFQGEQHRLPTANTSQSDWCWLRESQAVGCEPYLSFLAAGLLLTLPHIPRPLCGERTVPTTVLHGWRQSYVG